MRYFLSRVARAVRRGEIEVAAFCVLVTHFHLMLRSPDGRLAAAMRQIQGQYAQRFNWRHQRDGGLYCGRYFSSIVDSGVYRDNLIRYIDANAVKAGIVALPGWYPACSAYWYSRPEGPRWLARRWVEGWVAERLGVDHFKPELYPSAYRPRLSRSHTACIEARLNSGEAPTLCLDELLTATPAAVREWLERNAESADGRARTVAPCPLVPRVAVEAALRDMRLRLSAPCPGAPLLSLRVVARAGLLRTLVGLGYREIGARLRCSPSAAQRRAVLHMDLLKRDQEYALLIADLVHRIRRYIG